ncbi:MAG: hypothetical protein GX316_08170 [Firmicutes bacterium]|nr:hypothetical protein [Bacillota bacterium]
MVKRLFSVMLLVTVLIVSLTASVGLAAKQANLMGVTAIAETLEEGQKVTAVALEYSESIAAEAVTTGMFSVSGRQITRAYVNNTGDKGDVKAAGNHVVLELAIDPVPGSPLGSTLLYANGSNHRLALYLNVAQTADITTVAGNVLQAGSFLNTKERNLGVDGLYKAHIYTNPEDGTELGYRLFVPEDIDEPLPLVVFLHGGGEGGTNNIAQLLANRSALEWTTERAQAANPCVVLAPQCPPDSGGWSSNTGNLLDVIHMLIEEYNIDTSRIYGTGLSAGSAGTWAMAVENPSLYAALVPVCGGHRFSDKQIAVLADKPIWAFIAADDNPAGMRTAIEQLELLGGIVVRNVDDEAWNGFLRGPKADEQALKQLADAENADANIMYTEYIAGTVLPFGHWSWMAVFSTDAVREWVFAQRQETPYVPK